MPFEPKIIYGRGYTLIEMLFVIALIAVIASFAIATYRSHAQTERIDKAAIEMQQVLEAALTFHAINHHWPENNNQIPQCYPNQNPRLRNFIQHYLPNSNVIDNFGKPFCWGSRGGNDRIKALFWVAISVPNQNENMAKRIAARLPNAIVTSEPNRLSVPAPPCNPMGCYVRAEVPRPGAQVNENHDFFVSSGVCKTSQKIITKQSICEDTNVPGQQIYKITFRACPTGMVPQVVAAPNFLTMPPAQISNPIYQLNASAISCIKNADNQQYASCTIRVVANICWSRHCQPKNIKTLPGGKIGATYQVACVDSKEEKR